jgi:signal transduction histidine kinase/ligand-binding sensor domain-containing protein
LHTKPFAILAILFTLSIFSDPLLLQAQQAEKRFHHLTIEDGLSQSAVMAIYQDHQGYIWFGTQDGLNRYDGYHFTTYRFDPYDHRSISDDDIRVIYEDSQGDLWIGTQRRGLNRYDRYLDRFTRYYGEAEDTETLSSNTVRTLLEDSHGTFWVGTAHGLNILDRTNDTFRRIFHDPDDPGSLSSNQITHLFEDQYGTVWIGTSNGLNRFNRENGTFDRFTGINLDYGSTIPFGTIQTIHEDRHGNFWIGSENNGLFRFDRDEETSEHFLHDPDNPQSLGANSIFEILEDSAGNLWIGTGSQGLNIFDRDERIFYRYIHQPENPNSLSNNSINSLYESRENIIWAGTFAGGVSFHELRPELFRHYKSEPENPFSLSNNVVQAIHEDSAENIWVGTDGGGLNRYDPESGNFRHFLHQINQSNSISSNVILDIHETERGLWLATYAGGVDLFDPETETFRNFSHQENDPQSLSSNYVFDIFESHDGHLWFGTNWGGVSELPPDADSFNHLQANPDDPNDPYALSNDDVRLVFEDQQGYIWIGSYGGHLDRYDRESGRVNRYDMNANSTYHGSVAQSMLEFNDEILLVGTRGAGLLWFDRDTDQFYPIATTAQGLPGNIIHAMIKDDNEILWLSTNNGLARFHPQSGKIRTYGVQHGLQGREYNPGSGMKDRHGFIYFGGVNGFIRFHPDSLRLNPDTPPAILTELLIYNEPVYPGKDSPLDKQIGLTEQVSLPYDASVITIGYTALEFSHLKGNEFAYKLEGFDENWNHVNSQRRATYTNLNPGSYRFLVRAANNDGIWGEPAVLTITITPPFWKTAWFIGLMFLLTTGIIIGAYRWRIQHIRRRNIQLEQIIRERTQELRESNQAKTKLFSVVAHDLRNISTGIVGWSSLLQESAETGNYDEVKEYIGYLHQASTQFSGFLKNFLDWARSQSESLIKRPEKIDPAILIDEAVSHEEPKAIAKHIEIIRKASSKHTIYADPDMISIVLRNLLHNAIKFTREGGIIEIETRKQDDDNICISIRDNGVGMEKATLEKLLSSDGYITKTGTSGEKGTGLGITLCKDFVQKNDGTIHIESEPGKGSTVFVTLPSAQIQEFIQTG